MIQVKEFAEPKLNIKDALRYSGCKDNDDKMSDLVYECFDEIKDVISYRVCFDIYEIKKDDILSFGLIGSSSETLNRALSDCKKVLVFAATVGTFVDRAIIKLERISQGKALVMQGLGAERVESLCDDFCNYISNELRTNNEILKPRVSPGYGDMPLSMQKEVFKMLDITRKIGITLNENNFMIPTKSVTAFAGIKENI